MNPILSNYFWSTANTFITTFIVIAAGQIQAAGSVEMTTAFWIGIATAALRAAFKAILEDSLKLGRRN